MKDTTNQGRDDEAATESNATGQPGRDTPDSAGSQEVSPEPAAEAPQPTPDQPQTLEPAETQTESPQTPEPAETQTESTYPGQPFHYDDEGEPASDRESASGQSATEVATTGDASPAEVSTPLEEAPAPPPPPTPPSDEGGSDGDGGDDGEDRELGARMTFLEHLDELRKRILYSIIAMAVGFAVCWIFREEIFAFVQHPIKQVLPKLVVTRPTEAFTIYMKVAFIGGIFVAIPVILMQIWMFIAPGLYRREKRFVLPFLLCSTALFLLGAGFAYYIVLPPALRFLIIDFGAQFTPMITAEDYFDLVFIIIVGMGAVFQLPVLIAFLSMFGLIGPRFLWKNFRYAFLLITIIAAVVSPTTDPFNLLLWTAPMVILYLVGIVVSWIFKRRRAKREAAEAAG